jgi:hypothetical protein
MACLFSFAVAGEFNRGWSRRKEMKAEWTRRKAAWRPRRYTRLDTDFQPQREAKGAKQMK